MTRRSWNMTIIQDGENMDTCLIIGGILVALWLLTMLIYWFNLDNKLIYYVVRPLLNKNYDGQKRDKRL